jgi:adenylate cyclase class 2
VSVSEGDLRRNIELKATDPAPERSVEACRELGAEDHGHIVQQDTYFAVPHGGLKLREEQPGKPHLIQFERVRSTQEHESRYHIVEVGDGPSARAALAAAIGIRGVVKKRRRLFLYRTVRIHLDEVEDLGRFIELEAVAARGSDLTAEHQLISELRRTLRLTDQRLVSESYSELLLGRQQRQPSRNAADGVRP